MGGEKENEQEGNWVGQRQSIDTDILDVFLFYLPTLCPLSLSHTRTHTPSLIISHQINYPSQITHTHLSLSLQLLHSSHPSLNSIYSNLCTYMAMELQLGLALIPTNPTKPFDLNNSYILHDPVLPCSNLDIPTSKKRPLHFTPSSAFRRTLPLLLWNDHPNDGDDDDSNHPNSSFSSNDPYVNPAHFFHY